MGKLTEGIEAGDPETAFQGAHALKGVASNLALDGNGFLSDVRDITEILRPREMGDSKTVYDRIKPKYDELINILRKYK